MTVSTTKITEADSETTLDPLSEPVELMFYGAYD